MHPVNLLMLISTVLIASIECSPFKVEDEFDSDFGNDRDSYDDNRWGRSMRGRGGGARRSSGKDLEKSRDNDFREVAVGGEDEASEELASKNSDFERDENGRMKGRGDDEDEERPFMKEDDGVPDRYIKIKKAAQDDAIARSPGSEQRPRQSLQSDNESASVEGEVGEDGSANVSSDSPNEGSAAVGQQSEDDSNPKERQEEYEDDKREARSDEAQIVNGDVESSNNFEDDGSNSGPVEDVREEKSYEGDSQQVEQDEQPAEPEE